MTLLLVNGEIKVVDGTPILSQTYVRQPPVNIGLRVRGFLAYVLATIKSGTLS